MKRQLLATSLLTMAVLALAQPPTQEKTKSSLSELWSSLWQNADQRAESLLQLGHASDAAKLYTDPRRKAYAHIQAGEYAAAATELKTLKDTEANYNRGNALAQAGDLQSALDAYDAALKQDPTHQDARHNRDLVAKAMQKQKDTEKNKPQHDKSQGKPQDGKPQDTKDGSQNSQQSNKSDGKQGNQQEKQADKANDKPADKQENHQASNPKNKPGDKGQPNQGAQKKPGAVGNPDASHPQQTADDAEQARRDVNTTLQPKAKDATGDAVNTQGNATTSLTEKQIAQEQWLRSIPDDPGGLLRRKFLIEHLMRQRDTKP